MDGKYRFDVTGQSRAYFAACTVINGHVYVYAASLGGVNNINIYLPNGVLNSSTGQDDIMLGIKMKCETYDNFVDVTKEVQTGEQIADFDTYIIL